MASGKPDIQMDTEDDTFIIVMGETGSGKSTFINYAMESEVAPVGNGLNATTATISRFITRHRDRRYIFVDTLGFDARLWNDYEPLVKLTKWLKSCLPPRSRRRIAILYLFEIDRHPLRGSEISISPTDLAKHGMGDTLVIATTKWGNLLDETSQDLGRQRLDILSKIHGRTIHRFLDSYESAWNIIDDASDMRINSAEFQFKLESIIPVPRFWRAVSFTRLRSSSIPPRDTVTKLQEISKRLVTAFKDEKEYRQFLSCDPSMVQPLLDTLQSVLRLSQSKGQVRRDFIVATRQLSSKTSQYPRSFQLTSKDLQRINPIPVSRDSFTDMHEATFQGKQVSVNVVRVNLHPSFSKILKAIIGETVLWGQLSHPNIIPFYGAYYYECRLSLVFPWPEKRNIIHFLDENPTANRALLCSDTASGLAYLHDNDIIHGDLRATSILVDKSCRAYITEFGFSAIDDPEIVQWASEFRATSRWGPTRWQAPELLEYDTDTRATNAPRPAESVHTKATDVYAWSCVCYEVFTGWPPFPHIKSDKQVKMLVLDGARPIPPAPWMARCISAGLKDELWQVMMDCWERSPADRPSITQIQTYLADMEPEDLRPAGEWKAGPFSQAEGLKDSDVPLTLRTLNRMLLVNPAFQTFGTSQRHLGTHLRNIDLPTRTQPLQGSPLARGRSERREASHQVDILQDVKHRLITAFEDTLEHQRLLCYTGAMSQPLLDAFSLILKISPSDQRINEALSAATRQLSHKTGLCPRPLLLSNVEENRQKPLFSGHFADIRRGTLHGKRVRLKGIRRHTWSEYIVQYISGDAILWQKLTHDNILPFHGISVSTVGVSLVYTWPDNGTVFDFLKAHPTEDRNLLCVDVARGISYLHNHHIVHGNLKVSNIVIDRSRRACITDFGCSAIEDAKMSHASLNADIIAPSIVSNIVRWLAPELLEPETNSYSTYTMASDVYSWSCVCYSIFAESVPFSEYADLHVVIKVSENERPTLSSSLQRQCTTRGLVANIWWLMHDCWNRDPAARPNISQALARMITIQPKDYRPRSEWKVRHNDARELPDGSDTFITLEALEAILCTDHIPNYPTSRLPSAPEKIPGKASSAPDVTKLEALSERLLEIFKDKDEYRRLLDCNIEDTQPLLDTFQLILMKGQCTGLLRRNLIVATRRLSSRTDLFPQQFRLDGVQQLDVDPVIGGAFGDIHRGVYQGEPVCLKIIRIFKKSIYQDIIKAISREAIVWGQLRHSNLLPFIGLCRLGENGRLALVAPWAENGNVADFLASNPSANRILLCLDVAKGVEYLHDNEVVHGDLKGANILVDGSSRAYLADFGLSAVTDPEILHWATQSKAASTGGTVRWQAPELFESESDGNELGAQGWSGPTNTKATDVYAWGCVCYEIFTEHLPFYEYRNDALVMKSIISGVRPTFNIPEVEEDWSSRGLMDDVVALMKECWAPAPKSRPSISIVLPRLAVLQQEDNRPPGEWWDDTRITQQGQFDGSVAPIPVERLDRILFVHSTK